MEEVVKKSQLPLSPSPSYFLTTPIADQLGNILETTPLCDNISKVKSDECIIDSENSRGGVLQANSTTSRC